MRKGLLILGVFFAIATIGGFIQSNIPAAIAMLLLSIVSFWRASKPKTEIAWEIGGFFFTWIVSGGIIMIAKEGLYFPNPHIFIFGVVATIVCFYMCDKEPSRTQSGAKTNSNSTPQTSSMNVYSGSNSAPQKSSIVVPQTTTQKYNNESIYDRLKRLCNPVNFMENYDKEKVEIANQIYSKLMDANPNTEEIAAEAEKRLGIQIVDGHQIEDMKNKLHPKNFMNPYDAQKISLANELYSRIVDNITYSEYNKLMADAKPILDFWTKKEEEEAQKIKKMKEEREQYWQNQNIQKEQQKRREADKETYDYLYIKILGLIGLLVLLIVLVDKMVG